MEGGREGRTRMREREREELEKMRDFRLTRLGSSSIEVSEMKSRKEEILYERMREMLREKEVQKKRATERNEM